MVLSFFILSISQLIWLSHCADYCAWNRGKAPVAENNAATYNFLNGNFVRDQSYTSGGQSATYAGQPYYKMTIIDCYLQELWLYRHIDLTSAPAKNHWVISAAVGVPPISAYAYCGPLSGVTSDPTTPSGDCDGNWFVGPPQDLQNGQAAAQELDTLFKVMIGGCPQVPYSSIEFVTNVADYFAGTFTYFMPNVYRQAVDESESGYAYLMWQPKVWRWAVNEYIDEYDSCEQYKFSKGFTSVANVIDGDFSNSIAQQTYYNTDCDACIRLLVGTGDTPTLNPTAADALIPTAAPSQDNPCNVQWNVWPISIIQLCGNQTPQPVTNPIFTNDPTVSPVTGNVPSPTNSPVSGSGSGSVTKTPTYPGTAAPTMPTTAFPTLSNGQIPPTEPTTQPPTSPGRAGSPSPTDSGNGVNDGDTKSGDDGTIGGLDETVFWILLIFILVIICCFCCVVCGYFYNQKRVRGTAAFG